MDATHETRIIEICGCAFCDLGLDPVRTSSGLVHYHRQDGRGFSPCTNREPRAIQSAEEGETR